MTGTTKAVDDAAEAPGCKIADINGIGSARDGASLPSVGIRRYGTHSNVVADGLPPVLAGDPALRKPFNPISVDGKFLSADGEPFLVCGVTYGAFRPDEAGREFADDRLIERDFSHMVALGINTVRIPHTMPPRSLLDIAAMHGLRVMVGLSAEQAAGHLIDGNMPRDFVASFRAKVRQCAGHPALLCVSLGNEIMASQARWLGCHRIARYLHWLYTIVKEEDPDAIVTYVNYPTTEYLELPFLDVVSFNVYLESKSELRAYLARLQNIAGDRPLFLTELGLDSLRHGEFAQAQALDWQIRTTFEAGAAGAIIFSWTDEWFRAGCQVEDWAFGITDVDRNPKPAAYVMRKAFHETPFAPAVDCPKISVIVCSYNGARTLRQCLNAVAALDYPNYEVIVVNDGSTDDTPAIAQGYPVRLINQPNKGLSAARNVGLAVSDGDIVAYIDDDAFPHRYWLRYFAAAFDRSTHVGVGGPNLPPVGDGLVAECIAAAPGNPLHVLLSDEIAEHIPGCNMAYRKEALIAIDGFDTRFRTAGDDVDLCWRLQDRGWTIGFCPAAVVWHHRRNSIRSYWKQQYGYGKAEALLEDKWPQRCNALGHIGWTGRIYSCGPGLGNLLRQRIYHGVWGSAPFQAAHPPAMNSGLLLLATPEWYLVIMLLALLTIGGLLCTPLLFAGPLLLAALAARIAEAGVCAARATMMWKCAGCERLSRWLIITFLNFSQPLARLAGRLHDGLTPWRWRSSVQSKLPRRISTAIWSEHWREPDAWVRHTRDALSRKGTRVIDGGPYDRWDIEVPGGALATARLLIAVEDQGAGTQYIRFGIWPKCSRIGTAVIVFLGSAAAAAATNAAWTATVVFSGIAALVIARTAQEAGRALALIDRAVTEIKSPTGAHAT
jgi:glycosyltransferase involved in cell wall biosynthesis